MYVDYDGAYEKAWIMCFIFVRQFIEKCICLRNKFARFKAYPSSRNKIGKIGKIGIIEVWLKENSVGCEMNNV